jgi:choline dehydrogenase-like flavoprotein
MKSLAGKDTMPVFQAKDLTGDRIELEADAVVVGSGAAGAVVAYELAVTGKSVIILEAGPYVPSTQFNEKMLDMFQRMYVDGAGQTNAAGDITILQGRCVGGSTVVNAAACFRTPDWVLQDWVNDFGLTAYTPENLEPYFARVEKRLAVHENGPAEINPSSKKMIQGCDELGFSHRPIARNIKDCALTGFCLEGCASDRKQSMLVTYLPWAVEQGAQIYADTTVEKILVEDGRAVGVEGTISNPGDTEKKASIQVRAKSVILAAGAIQTPLMLLKQKLANSSKQVGKNFACHPSLAITALFKEELFGWRAATLGEYCDEFDSPEKGGFILEAGSSAPIFMAASASPGFAEEHLRYMKNMKNIGSMISLIHDRNIGSVELVDGHKKINYAIDPHDIPAFKKALRVAAEIWFAAGAEEVYLPTYAPITIKRAADVAATVNDLEINPAVLRITTYHPQGTCRMGANSKQAVVGPTGETHDVEALFIADASVFPTSLMVNPQITVYGLATYISERINTDHGEYFK